MTAALVSGFLLMFALSDGADGLLMQWYGFATREACIAAAPEILGQPINAGALVISDCEPGEYGPADGGSILLLGGRAA